MLTLRPPHLASGYLCGEVRRHCSVDRLAKWGKEQEEPCGPQGGFWEEAGRLPQHR